MIGRLDPEHKSATIVGAGASGLLIAYALKTRGFAVRVLEASERTGGLIDTRDTPSGPAETAAHSLMVTPEVQEWFDRLGVRLIPVNPDSRARFIWRNGKMRRFPLTAGEALRTIFRFFSRPRKPIDPETATLADWCEAYLGVPALRYLLAPFVTGVFAASPKELHLASAFPSLVPEFPERSLFSNLLAKRKTGDEKKPRPRMMAPEGGMRRMIERLSENLSEEIELNSPVANLPDAKNVIVTTPAEELAELISARDPASSQALREITYSPLITCTVFIPGSSFSKKPPRGVGVLIPRNEGLRILGVLFNSSSFSGRSKQEGVHSYTVMIGGTSDPEALKLPDPELTDLIRRDLVRLFGLRGETDSIEITRWQRAIPVYSRAIARARSVLESGFCATPGHMVFSNYSGEVSLRGLIRSLGRLA